MPALRGPPEAPGARQPVWATAAQGAQRGPPEAAEAQAARRAPPDAAAGAGG
ncbi:MAG TPA: hypothetical protein VEK86_04780 [Gemmatimonadales bacterium]|nr:hypothetical protein [Gemmatimonadales bacterium]